MREELKKEEVKRIIEEGGQQLKKAAWMASRGFNTEHEYDRIISDIVYNHFEHVLHRKFILTAMGMNWSAYRRFLAEYEQWKEGGLPESETGAEWLCYRVSKEEAASPLDKSHFFELMTFFCYPVEYYEPYPEGVPIPDRAAGCLFPDDINIGYDIWKDDGGLFDAGFRMGDDIVLTDHYGLKAHIKVKECLQECLSERIGTDSGLRRRYLGEGTIEGYTSETPRPVIIETYEGRIKMLRTHGDEEDEKAMKAFPLWKEVNAHAERFERRRERIIEAIKEKYAPLEGANRT